MRRLILLSLIALSVLTVGVGVILLSQRAPSEPTVASTTPLSGGEVPRISVQELNLELQGSNPPQVWDFRTAESFAQAHVPGSRLVAFDEITALAKALKRTQRIVALCA